MRTDGRARRPRVVTAAGLALAAALAWGCVGPWAKAPTPLPVQQLAPMPPGAACLFVFLPGRGDRAGVYRREGFAPMLAEHGVRAEALEVDLHLGYYARRLVHTRLQEDVVAPARSRGVREIWLVGVSMGGLGALIYDLHHRGEVDGLVLLAPYLGKKKVVEEIAAAGGVASWTPAQPLAADDWQREVWSSLKDVTAAGQGRPRLVLGYGLKDAFAPSNRLLADVLPAEQVLTAPGGHDWSVWKDLWSRLLASGQVGSSRCR